MMIPTIHLNGTSAERLLEAIEEAYAAIGTAESKLTETAPNGRDFYPQGGQAFYKAVDEHTRRMQKLVDVRRELEALAEGIEAQRR